MLYGKLFYYLLIRVRNYQYYLYVDLFQFFITNLMSFMARIGYGSCNTIHEETGSIINLMWLNVFFSYLKFIDFNLKFNIFDEMLVNFNLRKICYFSFFQILI